MSRPTYTSDHMEAAMCMWEHVLEQLRSTRDKHNAWIQDQQEHGAASLRDRVIDAVVALETDYQKAVADGYDECFDWEYVPEWMEAHVDEVLQGRTKVQS